MPRDAMMADTPRLKRTLGLPLVVLYGLGVTIGAGIYVLIGDAAGRAGAYAPLAFVMAALVMAPSALSFAELATRFPVAAGEAAYVREGFRSSLLGLVVGLAVIGIALVSAAAIALGSVGYIRAFVDLPDAVLTPLVVLAMGGLAAWGTRESVSFAAAMTVVEIGGLVLVVGAGVYALPSLPDPPSAMELSTTSITAAGFLSATLLAFFAFVGFEGIVNIAEETHEPERTLPRAILITLVTATVLYVAVAGIAVLVVPPAELAGSTAPLALVFERATGGSPLLLSAIAVLATLNGVIVQIIMGSRVLYGLADRGALPPTLARISATTGTPLIATAIATVLVLALAIGLPLTSLAEMTSRLTLATFALVNLALVRVKQLRGRNAAGLDVPMWVPISGAAACIGLIAAEAIG